MKSTYSEYMPRVVAFIDILGCKQHIRAFPKDPKLFDRLFDALERIKHVEVAKNFSGNITSDLEVSVFSDSIVISAKKRDTFSLVWTVGWLQAELLYIGILTRGGIVIGPTIHQDGILFGEGMLAAYQLEKEDAIYPRVVIANEVVRSNQNSLKNWTDLDVDGFTFVDFFKFDAFAGIVDELVADGYDPRVCYFKEVREYLLSEIEAHSEDDHILAKYRWIANRFNIAVQSFNKTSLEKVELI